MKWGGRKNKDGKTDTQKREKGFFKQETNCDNDLTTPLSYLSFLYTQQVHLCSNFMLNGVCVRWKGYIDLERLDGVGCIEFDEETAKVEDAILKEQVEAYNRRMKEFEEHRKQQQRQLAAFMGQHQAAMAAAAAAASGNASATTTTTSSEPPSSSSTATTTTTTTEDALMLSPSSSASRLAPEAATSSSQGQQPLASSSPSSSSSGAISSLFLGGHSSGDSGLGLGLGGLGLAGGGGLGGGSNGMGHPDLLEVSGEIIIKKKLLLPFRDREFAGSRFVGGKKRCTNLLRQTSLPSFPSPLPNFPSSMRQKWRPQPPPTDRAPNPTDVGGR